jgi:hypothetical protein
VAVPFLLINDVALALRISNTVAVGLLFFTGFTFGRHVRRLWPLGFSTVAFSVARRRCDRHGRMKWPKPRVRSPGNRDGLAIEPGSFLGRPCATQRGLGKGSHGRDKEPDACKEVADRKEFTEYSLRR